jgi:benzoylformate decarboxylase
MPFSIGVQLAQPSRPVICIIGDGAAHYSIQALYSARKYGLPVIFAVLNNGQYRVLLEYLKRNGSSALDGRPLAGLSLNEPPIDIVKIAHGYGVSATSLYTADAVSEAVRDALLTRQPAVLDIHVAGAEL